MIFNRQARMYSVSHAAKKLGVTTRAIQRACHRWKVGCKMQVGTQGKSIFMLSAHDISFLDEHLQRRPGKPSYGKK